LDEFFSVGVNMYRVVKKPL